MGGEDLPALASELAQAMRARGWKLATAESCTGGLIAACCTELPGSSDWFDRGFVTYSNASKMDMLGVPASLIEQHGAVSREVALSMAQAALKRSAATMALAVTGIAGPSGAVPGKPVGTVWLAWAVGRGPADDGPAQARLLQLQGERQAIRQATVAAALDQALAVVRRSR